MESTGTKVKITADTSEFEAAIKRVTDALEALHTAAVIEIRVVMPNARYDSEDLVGAIRKHGIRS